MERDAHLTILQVTPALDTGGVERTTVEMAQAVTQAGGRALVASQGGRMEQQLFAAGGELIRMPVASKSPITMLANVRRLSHAARDNDVRLIHARSRAPAWSALLAARRLKLPFVTTYHGIYSAKNPLKRFYNSVMARGDIVIANSEFTRRHVIKEHGINPTSVITIPRGADLNVFDPARVTAERIAAIRASWNIAPDEKRVIVIVPARLSRWKGQDLLIEAAVRVEQAANGQAIYILAGDPQGRDDYVQQLDAMIAAKNMGGIIRRVGHVHDMAAALAASDIAVFPPKKAEAFGRGAVEAQAMAVPVIAADHGGFTETVVASETGLLFTPGDADSLAKSLLTLIQAPSERRRTMGAEGMKRTRALYSIDALQRATLDVYRGLLQHGPQ